MPGPRSSRPPRPPPGRGLRAGRRSRQRCPRRQAPAGRPGWRRSTRPCSGVRGLQRLRRGLVGLDHDLAGHRVRFDLRRVDLGQCLRCEVHERGRERNHVRLVDRGDVLHVVAQDLGRGLDIADEQIHRTVRPPAASRREPMRRREVVQRDDRSEAALDGSVHHRPVVRDRRARDETFLRLDAGPLDAEPVGVEAEFTQHVHVLGPAVEAVDRVAARFAKVAAEGARAGQPLQPPPVTGNVVALGLMGGRGGAHQEPHRPAEALRKDRGRGGAGGRQAEAVRHARFRSRGMVVARTAYGTRPSIVCGRRNLLLTPAENKA